MILTITPAAYASFTPTELVSSESTSTLFRGGSSVAVDSSGNVYIAWADNADILSAGTDYDIFYKVYDVSLQQWTMTELVSSSTEHSNHPSLAVDSSGNVHVAWHEGPGPTASGIDIFYKMKPHGESWPTVTELVSSESTDLVAFPSLAVDSSGNVHVAWRDNSTIFGGTDWDIFYKMKSYDGPWPTGLTATELVSSESDNQTGRPSLDVDSLGNVHVAWQDFTDAFGGSDDDILYKMKPPGGSWLTSPTGLVSSESTTNSQGPSLAVDSSGNVHVAWQDFTDIPEAGPDLDIFYKMKPYDGPWPTGLTATELVSFNSTGSSYHPSLAVDFFGNVHVAWHDTADILGSGGDVDVLYKAKSSEFSSWTSVLLVSSESTDASTSPSVAADSYGNVHIAWTDGTDILAAGAEPDIFYKRFEIVDLKTRLLMGQVDNIEEGLAWITDDWTVSLTDIAQKLGIPVGGLVFPSSLFSLFSGTIPYILALAIGLISLAIITKKARQKNT